MAPTKAGLFERIRRDSWREHMSVWALARKYGVHRRLVHDALMRAEPAPRKTPERRSPRLDPVKTVMDEWLRADLDAPRKQRHSVKRIYARLLDEHAAEVSYTAVRDYVSRRRPEIWVEEERGPAKVFVPQHHPPGLEAEVDFGELWVRLAGVMTKCFLFVYRMSYSDKAVHRPVDRTTGVSVPAIALACGRLCPGRDRRDGGTGRDGDDSAAGRGGAAGDAGGRGAGDA